MNIKYSVGDRVVMNKTIGMLNEGAQGVVVEAVNPKTSVTIHTHACKVVWDNPYRNYDNLLVAEQWIHENHLDPAPVPSPSIATSPFSQTADAFMVGDIVQLVDAGFAADLGLTLDTQGLIVGKTDSGIWKVSYHRPGEDDDDRLTFDRRIKLVARPKFKVGNNVKIKTGYARAVGAVVRVRNYVSTATKEPVYLVKDLVCHDTTAWEESQLELHATLAVAFDDTPAPRFGQGDVVDTVPIDGFEKVRRGVVDTGTLVNGGKVYIRFDDNQQHSEPYSAKRLRLVDKPASRREVCAAPNVNQVKAPDMTVVALFKENSVRINELEYDGSLKKSVEWVDAVRNTPSKDHRIHFVKAIRAAYSKGVGDGNRDLKVLEVANEHNQKVIAALRSELAKQIKELQNENALLKDESSNLRMRLNDHREYSVRVTQQGHIVNDEFSKVQSERMARLQKRIDEVENQLCIERSAFHAQSRIDKATIRALNRRLNRLHHTLKRVQWISTNMLAGKPSRAERDLVKIRDGG
jgi:regulator of replication initiation timing